jgi:hypothetical protein
MKKVLYKDQTFWYKTKISLKNPRVDSKLIIYQERKGFLAQISRFKKLKTYTNRHIPSGEDNFNDRTILTYWITKFLDEYVHDKDDSIICIKCSKEVVDLYC